MFKTILIANRGEIACRVIKTARRMGIETVAVYSEADRNAMHVQLADEAVLIGPSPVAESYLAADKIIEACRCTEAKAVHPGYGFLSENAEFADKVHQAGLKFIGPQSDAIANMGDKITSKRLAKDAGVCTVPGCADAILDADHAVEIARQVGYPVMLKASAGGGGKGMRVAYDDESCREAFERASGEARTAFGDDRVFVEKFIEQPRHIEIQVLADAHGNVIHLGERECSLQRRHQKVIEESPSPFLDAATRSAMGEQAVALARAVQYVSAGTVEFIVDADRKHYFLEMNTRLQVEHPVTELVTGIDLVEMMIRIAAGEPLSITQDDVQANGWSIEARVYAEDPSRSFLPSIGRLTRYIPPKESEAVRVDHGVQEGGEISLHYDPMIAKVVTHGATREGAIGHMREALNQFCIRGIAHNVSFLASLINHDDFCEGCATTNTIASEYPDGYDASNARHSNPALLFAAAASIHRSYLDRAASISGQLPGYERQVQNDWVVVVGREHHPVQVIPLPSGGGHRVEHDSKTYDVVTNWRFGQAVYHGTVNGQPVCFQVERHKRGYRLLHWGVELYVMVLSVRAAELLACMPAKSPPDVSKHLVSPMPGLLTQLFVAQGSDVRAGQEMAVIEAMKMENVLRAECDGTVAATLAAVGDTLSVDQPIIEFE